MLLCCNGGVVCVLVGGGAGGAVLLYVLVAGYRPIPGRYDERRGGMTGGGGMTRGMIYDRFVDIRRVAMPMRLIRNLENTINYTT